MVWGKYVSITFSFTLLYIECRVFSEFSLAAATITLLTLVSCYYMTLFSYASDVGFTCKCHLSNIMSMIVWDGGDSVFILGVVIAVFFTIEEILEHVWTFQCWNFIEGFFCSSMFSCLNQGRCDSSHYSLPDRILRLDTNKTPNQSYVFFTTFSGP